MQGGTIASRRVRTGGVGRSPATRVGAAWQLVVPVTRRPLPEVDGHVLAVAHLRHFAGHPYSPRNARPACVRVAPPTRTEFVSVDDQVRAARIEILPVTGQIPALSAVLGERGEALQEGEITLGEFVEDFDHHLAGAPRRVPMTFERVADGPWKTAAACSRFSGRLCSLRCGHGRRRRLGRSLPTEEGGDRIGIGLDPAALSTRSGVMFP
jgi:hypothetical protein